MSKILGKGRTVKGVLLDITGNICNSVPNGFIEAIPGSLDAVERLKNAKIPFRLVTNETQMDRKRLCEQKLPTCGLHINMDMVFSPAPAVANAIRSRGLRPHLLIFPNLLPEFDGIDTTSPNCVVVGDAEHRHFTYENVNAAFKVLLNMKNPILLSMGKGKYYKEGSELVLDLGAYTAALEYACGIKAEVFGKPEKEFYLAALRDMGVEPEDAVMVGDDIEGDVGGAQKCGMKGILVRTGKFRPTDENHPNVKPDAIVDNLAAAVDLILS